MKILLTGANGQLGRCVQDVFADSDHTLIALDRQSLNIADEQAVNTLVDEHRPHVILNAAAYTAVDKAESEQEQARQINVDGPANLAKAAARHNALIIHISTDYVFDGRKTTPYVETDPTNPQGVYGQTKLDGEQQVTHHNPKHVILRTAWVFSEYGNNFVKTMLRLGKERDSLGVVADQVGCPTYAGDIAKACRRVVERYDADTAHYDIYHYGGDIALSWCDFARAIFTQGVEQGVLAQSPQVKAITTAEYPTPAQRPAYSVLSSDKFERDYGVAASDWRGILPALCRTI
ncbi:MAG: dTDP-4-dehydrorhamnose reductase [Spongiibacter sp.]